MTCTDGIFGRRRVAQRNFADERIGTAVRRLAEVGTPEQLTAFTSRVREMLREPPPRARRHADLLAMNPVEFERLVHELFETMGFDTSHVRPTPDHDVDAMIYRREQLFGGVYLIQAKLTERPVPVETVRAMIGSVHEMKAVKGIIVTTSWFGETGHDIAKRAGCIELIDGRGLRTLLQRHLGVDAHLRLPDPHRPTR